MSTTLTQASQQWMCRPADQRFLSLIEMQAFKSRIRDNSATKIVSSRSLGLQSRSCRPTGGTRDCPGRDPGPCLRPPGDPAPVQAM